MSVVYKGEICVCNVRTTLKKENFTLFLFFFILGYFMSMAESSLTSLTDDFLTCTICFEIFSDPKILSCLHTFCRNCLENHQQKQHEKKRSIQCPVCRQISPLSSGQISNLKGNFYIQNLIEFSESFRDKKCTFCPLVGTESPASSQCLTCRDFLCVDCSKRHNFTRETLSHEIATLRDIQSGKHNEKLRSRQEIPCTLHAQEGEFLKYFCDTCNVSVCRDCVILAHRDHIILAPSEAIKRRGIEIGTLLESLDNTMSSLTSTQLSLANDQNKIDDAEHDICHLIQDAVDTMVKKVLNEGKDAETKLKASMQKRRNEISRHQEKVQEKISLLENSMGFCRKVISDGKDGEIIFLQDMMRQRLAFLQTNISSDEAVLSEWSIPNIRFSKLTDSNTSLSLFQFETKPRGIASFRSIADLSRLEFNRERAEKTLKAEESQPKRNDKTTTASVEKEAHAKTSVLASKTTLSQESVQRPLTQSANRTNHSSIKLKHIRNVSCLVDQDSATPKLTSVAWMDNGMFVVADETNEKLKQYDMNGKWIKTMPVKNVITVACKGKDIYCGLRNGKVTKIIDGKSVDTKTATSIGYSCPPVVLKKDGTVLAIGQRNLYTIDPPETEATQKNIRIVNEKGSHIELDPVFPHKFKDDQIVVSDWNSGRVYFIKKNGEVSNVYRRYDKGDYWIPGGLACDIRNNVYIAEYSRREVTVIDPDMQYLDTIKLSNSKCPRCLACSTSNKLLVTCDKGVALFDILYD